MTDGYVIRIFASAVLPIRRKICPPHLWGGGAQRRRGGNEPDQPSSDQPLERSTVQLTGPDLGTLQIAQQRHGTARRLGGLPHGRRRLAVRLGVAVREIETRHVHPRLDHRAQHVRRRARGPDGADDARAPDHW